MWYMSTYKYLQQLNSSNKKLFTTADIEQLFEIDVKRTLEDRIKRLLDEKVLTQLERGKYLLTDSDVSDFEIAQFLYNPSYISLETALNFHGILSQFPFEITSVTTKSTEKKEIFDKKFIYAKLNTKLFTGYYKENDALIAYPEKALFDRFYMISKGLKTEQYLDEMDYANIDKSKVEKLTKTYILEREIAFKQPFPRSLEFI
ncbi:hypothetical protein GF357_01965 [Candidatus Dojkabacteria bacterium]|nr:hypothetical protein [Candidatus Dojkabacteria bacterium]